MRIAFHTPLNAFDDDRISGDRRMAHQIAEALQNLGHQVEPIADARSYMASPDALGEMKAKAEAMSEELLADWRQPGSAPDLWFTYHSYYKAPDLLAPAIAGQLGIPYLVAEASDSRRRAGGEWAAAVAAARASFAAADLHLCFTTQDRNSITPWLGPDAALVNLPPFIATRPPLPSRALYVGSPRLITVAMMRGGVKHESYLALARTLKRLLDRPWTLTVIGDGPLRDEVEHAFAAFPTERIIWRGALPYDEVATALAGHDIFVWPGLGEAYGLVYLEAQAAGLPVIAFDSGGVPDTVRAGETALLVPANDDVKLAGALARLLDDPRLRLELGMAAARFVATERSMGNAGVILDSALGLVQRRQAVKP